MPLCHRTASQGPRPEQSEDLLFFPSPFFFPPVANLLITDLGWQCRQLKSRRKLLRFIMSDEISKH